MGAHPRWGWDVHFGEVPITYGVEFDEGDIREWVVNTVCHIIGIAVGTDDEETIMTLLDDRMQGFYDPDAQLYPE